MHYPDTAISTGLDESATYHVRPHESFARPYFTVYTGGVWGLWGYKTDHGNPLWRSTLYSIFANPFYHGAYEYPEGSDTWRIDGRCFQPENSTSPIPAFLA